MFVCHLRNIYNKAADKAAFVPLYRSLLHRSSSISSEAATEESITISQSCVDRLKQIAPEGSFLRITIDGGGCSGFQYRFDLDSDLKDDDISVTRNGAKIVVDKLSLDFLKGATVEYKEELIRSSFRIVNNPQAESKCSCGVSFSVKME